MAERQDFVNKWTEKKFMYTKYVHDMIGRQEEFAREGYMTVKRQGADTYLVDETFIDKNPGNRRNGKDGPATRTESHTVDLMKKTCTCHFLTEHRMPCKHVILVTDSKGLRSTIKGQYQFRKDWVAPYFWRENYRKAYRGISVYAPDVNNNIFADVEPGQTTCRV